MMTKSEAEMFLMELRNAESALTRCSILAREYTDDKTRFLLERMAAAVGAMQNNVKRVEEP